MKFKPHSRFALPFCIFPMLIAGVYRNFPKQNTLDFYIFPKFFVGELLVWGLHSMIIKCFNRAESIEKSHIPHDCEQSDLSPIPISRKF